MGDLVERTDRDRALFERGVRDQLLDLLSNGDRRLLTGAVTRLIELQVATEEAARNAGIEINENTLVQYISDNREYFDMQVDRAITSFIGSVVSQEG